MINDKVIAYTQHEKVAQKLPELIQHDASIAAVYVSISYIFQYHQTQCITIVQAQAQNTTKVTVERANNQHNETFPFPYFFIFLNLLSCFSTVVR